VSKSADEDGAPGAQSRKKDGSLSPPRTAGPAGLERGTEPLPRFDRKASRDGQEHARTEDGTFPNAWRHSPEAGGLSLDCERPHHFVGSRFAS
jgi:hypothetical protein